MQNSTQWFSKLEQGYVLKGKHPGPQSIIMAGVHGNEVCGVEALLKLLPGLRIDNGTVYFVFGNPRAIEKNVRFTEFNLNRAFREPQFYTPQQKRTYEYKRAQFLKRILAKGEVLLDIHSTRSANKAFIICEKNAKKIVDFLPKEFTREVHNFDPFEPGATDGYMDNHNKIGITIECGQHTNPKSVTVAEKSIVSFLKTRGHMSTNEPLIKTKRQQIKITNIHITKSSPFKLAKKFVNFSPIKAGTVIGTDGKQIVKCKNDGIILFAHDCLTTGEEAFLLAKFEK